MICPRCQSQVADGIKFCGVCGSPMQVSQTPPPMSQTPPLQGQPQSQYGTPPQGAYVPPNQYEEYSSNQALGGQVPKAELHIPIYFEHHILLWKHPGVQIGFKSLRGVAKRFFAGMQIFLTEAQGPGNISFSRDAPGQIVALRLQPGQMVEVREHQFLFATGNVEYGFTFVQGAANILFSRTGLFIDQFTCQGGEGMLVLHGYGNVFEKMLAPGETLDVEPGAWLWKDPSVQMTVTTVAGSQRGGGILGAIGGMMAGASIILNRFTGPGRLGIQSMTYHPPQPEGAQQAGGTSNIQGTWGQLFNQ